MLLRVKKETNGERSASEDHSNSVKVQWLWQKNKSAKGRFLFIAIKKTNSLLFVSLFIAALATSLEVVMMLFLKDIMNSAFSGTSSVLNVQIIWAASLFAVLIPSMLLDALMSSAYMKKTAVNTEAFCLKSLLGQNASINSRSNHSKYISLIINDTKVIESFYISSRYSLYSALISLAGGIVLVIIADWRIFLLSAGILIIVLLTVFFMSKYLSHIIENMMKDLENYTDRVKEILAGMQVIKTSGIEGKAEDDYVKSSEKMQSSRAHFQDTAIKINAFAQLATSLFMFAFLLVSLLLVWQQKYHADQLLFAVTALSMVLVPSLTIFMSLPNKEAGAKAIDKVSDLLNAEADDNGNKSFDGLHDGLVFSNVSFRYADRTEDILSNISFSFLRGKKYLVVGPSGAGKSTLLSLLKKYNKPTGGKIMADGEDLSGFSYASYNKRLMYLDQKVFLFEDTIKNNICLFKDYSKEEISDACRQAEISTFIESKDSKDDFVVLDNGKNISGGEKIRIALARALIKKSDIFLLDEPFASIDNATASH